MQILRQKKKGKYIEHDNEDVLGCIHTHLRKATTAVSNHSRCKKRNNYF